MPWLIVLLGYLLGSIPTAYIAGRLRTGADIRRIGDENAGAANAFRQLGAKVGVAVGIIDAGKGAVAVLVAQAAHLPQAAVLFTGAAAVIKPPRANSHSARYCQHAWPARRILWMPDL